MSGSLAGIRVIDFTQVVAGPACTMMLADRGAEVIKVEPRTGDLGRQLGPPWLGGHSVIHMTLNRNKRGIVLDLKQAEDLAFTKHMVASADLVVESFRPGVMAKLGLAYADLRAIKPDLIYCSISAYGQTGADRAKPAVDGTIQAVSGLMSTTGAADGEPAKVQAPVVDMSTGMLATLAIFEALRQRDHDGKGRWLDISMYDCAAYLQQTALASYMSSGELPARAGSAAPYSAPNEAYATRDGWIMVAAYHPVRWQAFCAAIDSPHLAEDMRFRSSSDRVRHRAALTAALDPVLRTRTTREWLHILEAADILCAPVASYDEVTASPQFASAGLALAVDQPGAGTVQTVALQPFCVEERPAARSHTPAPTLGQHTDAIRALFATKP